MHNKVDKPDHLSYISFDRSSQGDWLSTRSFECLSFLNCGLDKEKYIIISYDVETSCRVSFRDLVKCLQMLGAFTSE